MFEPIIEILKRRWWAAFLALAIPLTAVAALTASLPALYRATATVLVQQETTTDPAGGAVQDAGVETRLRTIREEILSRQRLDAMIERFGLYPELRTHQSREAIINRMRGEIQIQPLQVEQGGSPEGTIAFSLSFRSSDPTLAAAVANALAESYVQENSKIRVRLAKTLEAQLKEVRARLEDQEARIGAYQERHTGELPQQVPVNMARVQQLGLQLQMNRDSQMRALDRMETLGVMASDTGHVAGSSAGGESPAANLERLNRKLAELQMTYNDNYPDIIKVKGQIAVAEENLSRSPSGTKTLAADQTSRGTGTARRSRTTLNSLDDEIRRLKAEERRLNGEIESYRYRIDAAPRREHEISELSRDYATTKELYASLLKRYEQARLADGMDKGGKGGQLRILDSAIRPGFPIAPNRFRLFLFGLMGSLALAAGSVMLLEKMDTSFHTIDDLRAFTRVPVLVSIPPLKAPLADVRRHVATGLRGVAALLGLVLIAAIFSSFGMGNEELVRFLSRGGTT